MRLKISGGTVVSPQGRYAADVLCVDGTIASVDAPGSRTSGVDEEIDASGLLVFPGFIDPHVHSRDPGLTEKEDFYHSTRAAAAGGVTTIFEMPNAVPPVTDVSVLRERAEQHEGVAAIDFGLWGISLGSENLGELPALVEEGVVGIKLFWGYALDRETKQLVYNVGDAPPENLILPPGNGDVFDVFETVAGAGGLLAAHCEDREVIEAAQRSLGHEMSTYEDFLEGRPDTAEAATIAVGAELARATGCRFHVVHVSSARGAQLVCEAQRDGVTISAETCPHYLTLTDESYDSIGPVMKIFPPVRRAHDRDALWERLGDGTITSLGSDHAPHTVEQKRQDLATAPAGAPGVETMVPVLLDEVSKGRISAERLSWLLSEGTARLYGLYPRKGTVLPGTDADFTIVDPDAEWTITNAQLHSKHPLSPWDGATGRGKATYAVVRGNVVMRDGEPAGDSSGRFVRSTRAAKSAARG